MCCSTGKLPAAKLCAAANICFDNGKAELTITN